MAESLFGIILLPAHIYIYSPFVHDVYQFEVYPEAHKAAVMRRKRECGYDEIK